MPRVNHDADMSGLAAKYGGAPGKYKHWRMAKVYKRKPKKRTKPKVVNKGLKSWSQIQSEFLAWKQTEDYEKWRYKQFMNQGGTCYYCDEPLYGTKVNIEHIIPKSKGGDNRKGNLVLACWLCNKEKNTKLLSRKVKGYLKDKNNKKRGTYLQTRQRFQTEEDFALELASRF